MQIQQEKLSELLGKVVTELGAAVMGLHVHIGDKLGFYRALGANGGLTSQQLADGTGTTERHVRAWLAAQAATGYVDYSAENGTFSLSPEQRAVFADDASPALMTGGFYSLGALYESEPRLTEAYRTGDGVAWGDRGSGGFCGAKKFYGPLYKANLVSEWLPALDGVTAKLKAGGRVADIGCGNGVSTILMAQAFPASQFYGFDFHPPSIERARELAAKAGVNNVIFQIATAKEFPGEAYDLIALFDCLHDLSDPVGAMAQVRAALDDNGTVLIVEPAAGNALEENLHPVGRVYYALSAAVCVPASLNQEVGLAQAGEARIREAVKAGGLSRVRVAVETPFNMVIEARG